MKKLYQNRKINKDNNQGEALYIINSAGIAYHQDAVLYIIIAKAFLYTLRVMIYSPDGLMRYNNGKIAIVDDMPLLSQWIKKHEAVASCFLAPPARIEPTTSP